jgi:hypothetical protein
MKKTLLALTFVFMLTWANAQTFTSSERSKCNVQVAFAVSEGGNFGEYSITSLVPLEPGKSQAFKGMPFVSRQLYSRVTFDEMFIVRFEPTGVTHFLDATVPNGYETSLMGGCALEQRPFYTRDGSFIIEASEN